MLRIPKQSSHLKELQEKFPEKLFSPKVYADTYDGMLEQYFKTIIISTQQLHEVQNVSSNACKVYIAFQAVISKMLLLFKNPLVM